MPHYLKQLSNNLYIHLFWSKYIFQLEHKNTESTDAWHHCHADRSRSHSPARSGPQCFSCISISHHFVNGDRLALLFCWPLFVDTAADAALSSRPCCVAAQRARLPNTATTQKLPPPGVFLRSTCLCRVVRSRFVCDIVCEHCIDARGDSPPQPSTPSRHGSEHIHTTHSYTVGQVQSVSSWARSRVAYVNTYSSLCECD